MSQVPPRNPADPVIMTRDLQLRFYREIGIAAVAAALGVPSPVANPVANPAFRTLGQRRAA